MATGPPRTAQHRETPRFRRVSRQLAHRLSQLRQQRGWSQEEAAARVGIGVAALRRLESGRDSNPSLALLVSAAAAYGVEVHQLLDPGFSLDQ